MVDTITQKQLASRLGVSISTISLALRNDMRISPDLRFKIQSLATELGYTYHLRKDSSSDMTRAVFISPYGVSNVFYSQVLSGAERVFQQQKISLHFMQVDNTAADFELHNDNVDGLLIVGTLQEPVMDRLLRLNRPIVLIDNNRPELGVDCVLIQNEPGIYQTIQRLHRWGHQRIAYLTGPLTKPSFRERLAGYRRAIGELNLPDLEIPCAESNIDFPRALMHDWMEKNNPLDFSALVACNDETAIGAMRGLQDFGVRVPDDLSVVGFDDVEICTVVNPALTTHHVHRTIIGEMSARMLIERIASPGRPSMALTIDTTFIERDSTRHI